METNINGIIISGKVYESIPKGSRHCTDCDLYDRCVGKELNLCEILKVGDTIYSPVFNERVVREILNDRLCDSSFICYANGKMSNRAEIVVYPSRESYLKYPLDAKKAWQEFVEANKPKRWRAEEGDEYWFFDRTYTPWQQEESGDIEDNVMYDSTTTSALKNSPSKPPKP